MDEEYKNILKRRAMASWKNIQEASQCKWPSLEEMQCTPLKVPRYDPLPPRAAPDAYRLNLEPNPNNFMTDDFYKTGTNNIGVPDYKSVAYELMNCDAKWTWINSVRKNASNSLEPTGYFEAGKQHKKTILSSIVSDKIDAKIICEAAHVDRINSPMDAKPVAVQELVSGHDAQGDLDEDNGSSAACLATLDSNSTDPGQPSYETWVTENEDPLTPPIEFRDTPVAETQDWQPTGVEVPKGVVRPILGSFSTDYK